MLAKTGRASLLVLRVREDFFGISAASSGEGVSVGRKFPECYRYAWTVSILPT
jgi:hypothetical protein